MNKNKKGFTLVELLAVIVILAVVILIAVTAVIPRMNNAKRKAFVDEALMYYNAATDAILTEDAVDCYDASNMDEYIKQSKDGYSGALFINENERTLYLTNGKYYLVANNKQMPSDSIVTETKPTYFVSSCTDTSKTFTITYDLDGGTLSSANPSSYTANTPTFTLNNPTKSGYRFLGWSSKNEFNKNMYLSIDNIAQYTSGSYSYSAIPLKPNTSYYVSIKRYNGFDGKNNQYLLVSKLNADNTLNVTSGWTSIAHPSNPNGSTAQFKYTTGSDGYLYIGRSGVSQAYLNNIWANTDVQIEQGTTATDYQEYMEPTTNAKIYRGSTGNKKFIANWEAI